VQYISLKKGQYVGAAEVRTKWTGWSIGGKYKVQNRAKAIRGESCWSRQKEENVIFAKTGNVT